MADESDETERRPGSDHSLEGPGAGPSSTPRRWPIVAALVAAGLIGIAVWGSALWPRRAAEAVRIADVSSERLLASGSVVGFADDWDTHAWLGIPYARPPVRELRWRAPHDPAAWVDTLDALALGSPCPQIGSLLGGLPADDDEGFAGDEDCLTLNIWAPRAESSVVEAGGERLPVMVWIHGGGNRVGQGGGPMYDGAQLAGRENVVVVSLNYRLGPFGWLSLPELRAEAEGPEEASGNFGLLDQIQALRWVRANIAEFGGDPGNVTIFGESAGATDVLALLLARPARGLFHRAIAQSGSTDSVSRAEAENAVNDDPPGHRHSSAEIVVSLLADAGVVPDREAARRYAEDLPDADLLEFLRGRPAREILAAYLDPADPLGIDVPTLIRDGVVLPEGDWLATFRAGRFQAVPMLLGSNRDEKKLFLSQDPAHVRKLFGVLYRIRDAADYERRARYHSDLKTARSVDRPAAALSEAGRAEVFAYRFDWDEEPHLLGTDLSKLLGAAHGFELPFLFGSFDLGDPFLSRAIFSEKTRASRERLSERMMAYWAEFARTGRPGRGGREDLPEWPAWASDEAAVVAFPNGDSSLDSARTAARESSRASANVLLLDTETDGGIRVARVEHSRDLVIAAIEAEPDLAQEERCAILRDLFADRPDRSLDEYRRMGLQGCADSMARGEEGAGPPRADESPPRGKGGAE